MGDITQLVLDGIVCEQCGSIIDGYMTDYPRTCADCKKYEDIER
jgi:hypothetical protein